MLARISYCGGIIPREKLRKTGRRTHQIGALVAHLDILDEGAVRLAEEYRRRKDTSVLSIMFTDIEGSTELRENLGEVAYELQREACDRDIRDLVEAGGAGALVKSTGDGALVVFAEPSTAVVKALALQELLASHDNFRLRIGIDMGQVTVTSQSGIIADVFGRQVNRAARIQSIAAPKHVLTSFHVYDCAVGWLTGTNVKWHCHGRASLKGFSEPASIHEPYDPRFLSPQTVQLETEAMDLGSGKQSEPSHSTQPVRIRPTEFVPTEDPISFYGQAFRLIGARFLDLTQNPPEVLWVDDFPDNNLGLREILLSAGFRVDQVLSTSEAVAMLTSRAYTLVVTDMGRGSNPTAGIELLRWMRSQSTPTPTVVFCSSRGVGLFGSEAIKTGALLCTAGFISLLDGILQITEQSFYHG
jgi:class 3 adenylate cyclase/CheY-like chemotaxis protein